MAQASLERYIHEISGLKKEYRGQFSIRTGLEVDYIAEFEDEITLFLDTYGPYLDDSILSVHFLRTDSSYLCLDYDEHTFKELISACGSIEAVYEQYYRSIYSSIVASLGVYKPKESVTSHSSKNSSSCFHTACQSIFAASFPCA